MTLSREIRMENYPKNFCLETEKEDIRSEHEL
jgi:hypothetical protein